MTLCETIIVEIIKIVVLGAIVYYIKNEIDKSNKEKDNEKRDIELENEFKTIIVDEYISIFSKFYEIRKLYHSTFIEDNKALDNASKKKINIECLIKSAEYEGHYGALKVRLTNHYNLPKGDWTTTSIETLTSNILRESNFHKKLRLKLDLLGEYYDLWRNSIEQGIKISAESNVTFYNLYNEILLDLNYRKIISPKEEK